MTRRLTRCAWPGPTASRPRPCLVQRACRRQGQAGPNPAQARQPAGSLGPSPGLGGGGALNRGGPGTAGTPNAARQHHGRRRHPPLLRRSPSLGRAWPAGHARKTPGHGATPGASASDTPADAVDFRRKAPRAEGATPNVASKAKLGEWPRHPAGMPAVLLETGAP